MKNKGITLIALIITIIILLILAGITIGQLTGNGLFENAKQAKEKYENAQAQENDILQEYESQLLGKSREEIMVDKDEYMELLSTVANLKTKLATIENKTIEIDYENVINLTSTLDEAGKTYTVPENGYVFVYMRSDTSEKSVIDMEIWDGENLVDDVIIQERTTSKAELTDHIIVNKGVTLKIYKLNDVSSYDIKFYPFK